MNKAYDQAAILGALYGEGIIALQGAYPRALIDTVRTQVLAYFEEARSLPSGAAPRGPNRWYVELQPETIDGFTEIASHPWFVAVCEAVLGTEYKIVEFGFDVPLPGAADQPWHRDFPAPASSRNGHRLSSLAFNLALVDTRADHGPFEIAPGTQWDDVADAKTRMFPPPTQWDHYRSRAVQKLPRRGDLSARTGLAIHRGTANRSGEARPVLILGVVSDDVTSADHHQLEVTQSYLDQLPAAVRRHLFYRLTASVGPVRQRHMIEGLLNPAYE
jgi:hypothetical protein